MTSPLGRQGVHLDAHCQIASSRFRTKFAELDRIRVEASVPGVIGTGTPSHFNEKLRAPKSSTPVKSRYLPKVWHNQRGKGGFIVAHTFEILNAHHLHKLQIPITRPVAFLEGVCV